MVMIIGITVMIVGATVQIREVMHFRLDCRGSTGSVIVSEGADGAMAAVPVLHIFVSMHLSGGIRHKESKRKLSKHLLQFIVIQRSQRLPFKSS